jgi:hypothetical protein
MYLPDTDETFFENVLSIPEQHVNDYKITHKVSKAGKEFQTASPRTAIFGNHEMNTIQLTNDAVFHRLSYNGGTLMTDYPIEQAQHDTLLRDAHGRVLVGGLGLGYAVKLLSHNPNVDEIIIVEKSPEVIQMVWPHTYLSGDGSTIKTQIIQADLMDFVKNPEEFMSPYPDDIWFDLAFYDIWSHDGEGTFHEVVVPLLKHSASFVESVINWNEDVMRGQLFMGLLSRMNFALMSDPDRAKGELEEVFAHQMKDANVANWKQLTEYVKGSVYHNWSVPFFRSLKANTLHGVELKSLTEGDSFNIGSFDMPKAFNGAASKYAAWYGNPNHDEDMRELLEGGRQ